MWLTYFKIFLELLVVCSVVQSFSVNFSCSCNLPIVEKTPKLDTSHQFLDCDAYFLHTCFRFHALQ